MKEKCIYCLTSEGITKDHVFPKCLFSPGSDNLVTVPCCKACNQFYSPVDEYIKHALVLNEAASTHPDVKFNLNKTLRAIINRNYKKIEFKKNVINNSKTMHFSIDLQKAHIFLRKIVKGILFTQEKTYLDEEYYEINVKEVSQNEERKKMINEKIKTILEKKTVSVGKNKAIQYKYIISEIPPTSAFLISFYDSLIFFCCVTPNN